MVEIGKFNELRLVHRAEQGAYLDGEDLGEILLPRRYVPEAAKLGDLLTVFVYYDSEDRLIATTEKPFAQVGEFAHLNVASVERVGAFLDWGLPKDLFLPFSEQTRELRVGYDVVVYIYLDNTFRISASMRVERNLNKVPVTYAVGDQVNVMIYAKTDLGFKAIINGQHIGMLFANEVFEPLEHGAKTKAFIKQIRPDGKIDLILREAGHKATVDIGENILAMLERENGFLALNEKTPPEMISKLFGVSKKKYKIALGGLYKRRLITVDPDGIRLVR